MNDIIIKICNILSKIIKADFPIDYDINKDFVQEYSIDSLNYVKMIVDLEEEFNVTFNDEVLLTDNLTTLQSIINIIDKKHNN